jgi:hypothetical protein
MSSTGGTPSTVGTGYTYSFICIYLLTGDAHLLFVNSRPLVATHKSSIANTKMLIFTKWLLPAPNTLPIDLSFTNP